MNKPRNQETYTPESRSVKFGKKGTIFFTNKKDKDITAIATYYGRKVKTERLIAVHKGSLKVKELVQVTILK